MARWQPAADARGATIASLLADAWHQQPPPVALRTDALDRATPLLLTKGVGAFAWWRVRDTSLAASRGAEQLRDAYRIHALRHAIYEEQLEHVALLLQRAGVRALVFKGAAVARLYPMPWLRPFGDHDLLVAPADLGAARRVFEEPDAARPLYVDLHGSLDALGESTFDALFARGSALRGATMAMLAPEDHLRVLCVHLAGHGGSRPLWLLDVALLLARSGDSLDWSRVFMGSARTNAWVTAIIDAAHTLLGAPQGAPARARRGHGSPWVAPALVREWGTPRPHAPPDLRRLYATRAGIGEIALALRERWPNPVLATSYLGVTPGPGPRLPLQAAALVLRAARFARRVATLEVREEPRAP